MIRRSGPTRGPDNAKDIWILGAGFSRQIHGDMPHRHEDAVAVSFGGSPGTNPTAIGGGVWKGALVGMDTRTRERIEGDAVIEIDDFARPDVDVALTGIEDARGHARSDLHWEDIPVVQGAFRVQDMVGSIEGRFYGSDHGEVGGIFECDLLTGAFGASR